MAEETDEQREERERQEREERERRDQEDKDKSFSQADVDRIVRDRLARDRKDRPSDDEIAELRRKAEAHDQREQESKDELTREREAREKAERERDEERETAKTVRLTSALLAEAAKPDRKVASPADAIALLDRTTLTLDGEGLPTNAAEAVDKLLEEKPFLVSSTAGRRGNADQGARDNAGSSDLESLDDPAAVRDAVGKL